MGNKQSKNTQEEEGSTDDFSGVLQVMDDDEEAPPLDVGLLEISEDDLSPQQKKMLHERAADGGGNITAQEALDIADASELEPAKVQIGVVGDAGAGKSMFINSYRALSPGDVGAAEVSAAGHTTTESMSYDIPGKSIILVDFPGVLFKPPNEEANSRHTAQEDIFNISSYLHLHKAKMQECDFFLIFMTSRLSNNVVWIAKEARNMGKRLLFVRSQVDIDIEKAKQDKHFPEVIDNQIAERAVMDKFKKSGKETLQALGYGKVDEADIFIISGLKDHVVRRDYDMGALSTAMLNSLSTYKQSILINNIQDFSIDTVTKKGEVMRKRTWAVAAGTAAVSAAPVPVLGVALDITSVFAAYKFLRRSFSIDDASLEQLAIISNKSALTLMRFRNRNSTLWRAIKNSSGPLALRHLAAAAASSVTVAGLAAITTATAQIVLPIVGGVIAAPASFALIVFLVRKFIDEMEKCATELFKFAFSDDMGPADIGIVGDGNVGEAAFINSFGSLLQGRDKNEPNTKTILHKTLDNIVIVELPPPHVKKTLFKRTFDEEAYFKSFGEDLKACSVLLVFIAKTRSEELLIIARKAKEMELKVLFIRTCQDEDELQHICNIQREVYEDLKVKAHLDDIAETDIFIVNAQYDSMVQDKWPLGSLRAAILHAIDQFDMTDRNLMQMERDTYKIIELKEGQSSKPNGNILRALYHPGSPRTIKPLSPDWKKAIISVGVIGEPEANIRTFIRSLLGLCGNPPEQTRDSANATVYHNPDHPCNISVVQFPMASLTPGQHGSLSVSRYMEFHRNRMMFCDLFLAFCQNKVSEEAAWVANKAMELKKKVLLVGSKHGHTTTLGAAAIPTKDTEDRELCLSLTEQFKKYLHKADKAEECSTNSTFIISDHLADWLMGNLDVARLKMAILSQFNDLQQQAFVICCPDMSPDFVSEKSRVLKEMAWIQAVNAMDVKRRPCLLVETPVKIAMVRESCKLSLKCFGLVEDSLTKLAAISGTNIEDLKIFAQRNLPMCTKLLSQDTDPAPPDNIRTLASLLSKNSSTLLTLGLANWSFTTTIPVMGFGGKALNVVVYFLCRMIDEQAECAKDLHNFAFNK